MHVTAIIAAGGRGRRFGAAEPKQLLSIGGRPILERSVEAFTSHPSVNEVIVALPDDLAADPPAYLRSANAFALRIVAGGVRRQDSVANAFAAVAAASDLIVIHDAARPFASVDLIARTIAAAAESGAAVAAVQSRDTVKRTSAPNPHGPADAGHYVQETIPRETIFLAQTPQAFQREVLRRALELGSRDGLEATDEAALVELAGLPVRLVEGEASNIKITTADDMAMAEAIAARQSATRNPQSAIRTGRTGAGYDLHRLVEGRPLIIGGVTIPWSKGALGHSDADVVCHALTDAILGAAGAGNIGQLFPDSDPQWKDADSMELLRTAHELVRGRGLTLAQADCSVITEQPRLGPHLGAMAAALASRLGVESGAISVKAKTNEGMGFIGRGEGLAVIAVAVLEVR